MERDISRLLRARPVLAGRIERAEHILVSQLSMTNGSRPIKVRISGGKITYRVRSGSKLTKSYAVDPATWTCECPDHTRRSAACKHVMACWLLERAYRPSLTLPVALAEEMTPVGVKTDNPCPREATERRFADAGTPDMCAPRARLSELSEKEDGWRYTLDQLEEILRGPVVAEDPYGHLERIITNARDEAREHYARAHGRAQAAHIAADDHDERLTPEQSERLAVLVARSDAFADTRTLVEDAPEDVLGLRDRWLIVDALTRASEEAGAEHVSYKSEIGLDTVSA